MGSGGSGGVGDLSGLLRQAQKVKEELARIQAELAETVVEGSAANGMAKATFTGTLQLTSVRIDPRVLEGGVDLSMIEDLVTVAVRHGLQKAQALARERMDRLTGGTHLPGLLL
ncbi:MAG: YbaB/EbfC family nucleoid-associated protein [Planctomycetota bacterium]